LVRVEEEVTAAASPGAEKARRSWASLWLVSVPSTGHAMSVRARLMVGIQRGGAADRRGHGPGPGGQVEKGGEVGIGIRQGPEGYAGVRLP